MKDRIEDKEWEVLHNVTPEQRPVAFVKYCQDIIERCTVGEISLQTASYWICDAIRYEELGKDPISDEIIEIACDLELPAEHRGNINEEQSWKRLNQLLGKYTKKNM